MWRRVLWRGDKIHGVTSPGGTNVNILCHEKTIFRFILLTCTSRNYKLTTAFISDNCRPLCSLNQDGTLVSKLPNFSRGSSHVTFLSASHFTSDYLLSIKLKWSLYSPVALRTFRQTVRHLTTSIIASVSLCLPHPVLKRNCLYSTFL